MNKFIKKIKDRVKYGCDLETFHYLNIGKVSISDIDKFRVNLVISTVDKQRMYGGLTTAFNYFNHLVGTLGCHARIIVTDIPVREDDMVDYEDYKLVQPYEDMEYDKLITSYTMESNSRSELAIRCNDIFVSTYWTTMYLVNEIRKIQIETIKKVYPAIYLIQDYEPGFYKWSSEYLLIESTYRFENTFAVMNSKNLYDYFEILGYEFEWKNYFEPRINVELKKRLESRVKLKNIVSRKNQVVIYGRPFNGRNCFTLIIAALKRVVQEYEEVSEWDFYSIGSRHKPIPLGNGKMLVCMGKLSLNEYADVLLESKVGVSLMCSPHPSYPPLEMASFGVNTVTNSFLCKDLSLFSPNICSVTNLSINNLSSAIIQMMNRNDGVIDLKMKYFNLDNQYDLINNQIKEKLEMYKGEVE